MLRDFIGRSALGHSRRFGIVAVSPIFSHGCHTGDRRTVPAPTRRANHFAYSESCQASFAKILSFRFSEVCDFIRPSRLHLEGRIAIVTDVGSGERWTHWCRQTSGIEADERNRVVPIPRRWDQACGWRARGRRRL